MTFRGAAHYFAYGTKPVRQRYVLATMLDPHNPHEEMCARRTCEMNSIIYLVGLVVIVMFVLSAIGLHS